MAIKAFAAGQRKTITYPGDDKNPTRFIIQAVPHRVTTHIRDQSFSTDGGEVKFNAGVAAMLSLQAGLYNVENLHGDDEQEVKVQQVVWDLHGDAKHTCVTEGTLDLLPTEVTTWLTLQIQKFGGVTVDEVKKSVEQS